MSGYNIFIGSTTGIVKGVSIDNETGIKVNIKNFINTDISNKNEINCMTWYDHNQNDILIAKKNGIKIYNTNNDSINDILIGPQYSVCGVFSVEELLVFGTESGIVRFWEYPFEENQWHEIKVGNHLSRVKQSILSCNIFATGGKENDLKLWDINTKQCTFSAKNIKPDHLQLAVPIWVSDICFLNDSEKIAYCSKHGHIRLYDPLLQQRRPVINTYLRDEVFTCIATTSKENHFLAGTGSGNLYLVDLRGKGLFIGKYKGFSGCVKDVMCTSGKKSLVISVSLDRHFRIHDFENRKLLVKEYSQSRLTTVLAKSNIEWNEELINNEKKSNSVEMLPKKRRKKDKYIENDFDEVFRNMETIREVLDMENKWNDKADTLNKKKISKKRKKSFIVNSKHDNTS